MGDRTFRIELAAGIQAMCHDTKPNSEGVPVRQVATDKNMPFILGAPGFEGLKMEVVCEVDGNAKAAAMPTLTGNEAVVRDGVAQFTRFRMKASKAAYTSDCHHYYILIIQPVEPHLRTPERMCSSEPIYLTAKIRREKRCAEDAANWDAFQTQMKRIKVACEKGKREGTVGGSDLESMLADLTYKANHLEQWVAGRLPPQDGADEVATTLRSSVHVEPSLHSSNSETLSIRSVGSDYDGQLPPMPPEPRPPEPIGMDVDPTTKGDLTDQDLEDLTSLGQFLGMYPPATGEEDFQESSEDKRLVLTFEDLQNFTDDLCNGLCPADDSAGEAGEAELGEASPFRGGLDWTALGEEEDEDADPDKYRSLSSAPFAEPRTKSDGPDALQAASRLSELLATLTAKLKIPA